MPFTARPDPEDLDGQESFPEEPRLPPPKPHKHIVLRTASDVLRMVAICMNDVFSAKNQRQLSIAEKRCRAVAYAAQTWLGGYKEYLLEEHVAHLEQRLEQAAETAARADAAVQGRLQ
jgi:hypothetical protein